MYRRPVLNLTLLLLLAITYAPGRPLCTLAYAMPPAVGGGWAGGSGGGGVGSNLGAELASGGLVDLAAQFEEEAVQVSVIDGFSPLPGENLAATSLMDNTIVYSIGHYFGPAFPQPGNPNPSNIVIDFLINQTQETGGGAVLPVVQKDLDLFDKIYHRIQAPTGTSFRVDFPDDATQTSLSANMAWSTGMSDSGGSLAFAQIYENFFGIVPESGNYSAVGDGNQFFTLTPDIQNVSDLEFSAVTFAVMYQPRTTGLGMLSYRPTGFGQPPGTSRSEAYFAFSYVTSSHVDPGRFVTFVPTTVPEPGTCSLLMLAGVMTLLFRGVRSPPYAKTSLQQIGGLMASKNCFIS